MIAIPESPRILICRLSAIGDCLLTTPLLNALRAKFPDAHLSWIVETAAASLLDKQPCLDELITVSKRWMKSPRTILQLRRDLRAREFDITIDPQGLTKSSFLAYLTGAPIRIGFAQGRGRELSRWLNNRFVAPKAKHLVDAQLELLGPLGINQPTAAFQIPLDETAQTQAASILESKHLGCRFAVINVGAGWTSRVWPAENYGHTARRLGALRGTPSLVVWAGEQEKTWATEVVAASGGHAILAPPTTLVELAAILRRASLFIGSDTGPLHLAAAVETPCVGLYGVTDPAESGPYGTQHIVLQESTPSRVRKGRRKADNSAMRQIDPDKVADAAIVIIDRLASGEPRDEAA